MRKGKHGGGNSPKKEKSKLPVAQPSNSFTKVKHAEDLLSELLKSTNVEYSAKPRTGQALENRIANITEMTEKLAGALKTREQTSVETSAKQAASKIQEKLKENEPVQLTKPRSKIKKKYFVPSDSMENGMNFTKFYILRIPISHRRKVNPYHIIDIIETKTGSPPKDLTGYNSTSFTIEVKNSNQGNLLGTSLEINQESYTVEPHPFFNKSRGLIYVEDVKIDDLNEFKTYLQEQHSALQDLTEAPFIKTRNPGTQVFILEFGQDHLPHSVYISGERSDTVIYPMRNKPLMCKRCLIYGHAQKYCRAERSRCETCGEEGHTKLECTATVPCCARCGEGHPAGHRECQVHQHEQKVVDLQQSLKVTPRRARQILDNNNEFIEQLKKTFNAFCDITMDEPKKRQLSPWIIEKCITAQIGNKPKSVRSKNATTLTVEVFSENQAVKLMEMTSLAGISIVVAAGSNRRLKKGLTYIYNYDLSDFNRYKAGLISDLGVADVEEARWIKPRNSLANPILLSFYGEVPNYISIPGELAKNRVYPHVNRPQICKKCQMFFHGEKYCARDVRCGACSEIGHRKDTCSATLKCPHCSGDHEAGDRSCPEYRFQQEVLAVQANEGVSRQQAIFMIRKNNPSTSMNFSKAVTSLPKRPEYPPEQPSPPSTRQIDIVCQSPSGRLYQRTIDNPAPREMTPDINSTSENNPIVRNEAKRIFEEDEAEEDLNQYQIDLKRAKSSYARK